MKGNKNCYFHWLLNEFLGLLRNGSKFTSQISKYVKLLSLATERHYIITKFNILIAMLCSNPFNNDFFLAFYDLLYF